MNLIWRAIWTFIFSRFSPPAGILDAYLTSFHVLPTDIDLLMHMNNGRYLSFLDLARLNFLVRNKTFSMLTKHRIYPVVASEMIRFRQSLRLFQRFEISTRLIGWDDKFFYFDHQFYANNEVYSLSLVKIRMLRKQGGGINPCDLLTLFGLQIPQPTLPAWIQHWELADQAFHEETIKANR